ncbi:hypothetical protein [Aliivibrio finisterrensis]|uniref:Tubulin/FtsZ GTPase domain-containing protein n=1 Tax=Aliivibrio finisterrensis TaxID=511998 RepID=A0A6N6RRT7_9GAMM|nr:hypothetical protein [Aliivibrio finisterrensis]KAB2824306.1 hypothetical protein F8B77_10860 [Aliivibrio finisterrensis]
MTKTLIIGVSGAGTNISQYLVEKMPDSPELLLINSDSKSLDKHLATNRVYLDLALSSETKRDLRLTDTVERMKNEILSYTYEKTNIIVVVGLGGNTGTNSIFAITNLTNMSSKNVTLVAVLPFRFESSRRRLAEQKLTMLKNSLSLNMIEFDNDSVMNRDVSLTEGFQKANEIILSNILATLQPNRVT